MNDTIEATAVCSICEKETPLSGFRYTGTPKQRIKYCRKCESVKNIKRDAEKDWKTRITMPDGEIVKKCAKCGIIYPIEKYHYISKSLGARSMVCQECAKKQASKHNTTVKKPPLKEQIIKLLESSPVSLSLGKISDILKVDEVKLSKILSKMCVEREILCTSYNCYRGKRYNPIIGEVVNMTEKKEEKKVVEFPVPKSPLIVKSEQEIPYFPEPEKSLKEVIEATVLERILNSGEYCISSLEYSIPTRVVITWVKK